jgi:Domain of unknown function (DUF397)
LIDDISPKGIALSISQSPLVFRKSRRCDSGSCVEVAETADGMAMRDSDNPDGPILYFTREQWADFLAGARGGDFD